MCTFDGENSEIHRVECMFTFDGENSEIKSWRHPQCFINLAQFRLHYAVFEHEHFQNFSCSWFELDWLA